jgi:hypothetical protein
MVAPIQVQYMVEKLPLARGLYWLPDQLSGNLVCFVDVLYVYN